MTSPTGGNRNKQPGLDGGSSRPKFSVNPKYEAEEPIREIEDFFEDYYSSVSRIGDPNSLDKRSNDPLSLYDADEDNNLFVSSDHFILSDLSVRVEVEQLPSKYAREIEGEEKYEFRLSIFAEQKEDVENLLDNLDEEYGDILKRMTRTEHKRRAEAVKQKKSQEEVKARMEAQIEAEEEVMGGGIMGIGREQNFEPVDISSYSRDDIALPDEIMSDAEYYFEASLENPELFDRGNSDGCTGIILYGDPGVGKTLLAKVMASDTNATFFQANIDDFRGSLVGQSTGAVTQIFEDARGSASRSSPSVIYLEEADSILKDRDAGISGVDVGENVVNTFLDEMDGLEELENVLVVGSTNREGKLDEAATRPGRFNKKIHVPRPDRDARAKIFEIHTIDEDPEVYDPAGLNIPELAEMSEGFTGADIDAVVSEAEKNKRKELAEEHGGYSNIPLEEFRIDQSYLESAVEEFKDEEENDTDVRGVMPTSLDEG